MDGTMNRRPRHVQILVYLNVDGCDHFPLAPQKGLSNWVNKGELFHELLVVSVHRHVMDLASLPPAAGAARPA